MPSIRIAENLNEQIYFVSPTIKHWYYLFDRWNRWDILANCLKYFVEKRELKIYGYVFMLNHIHLIVQSPDVSGFLRDFKKFTSGQIVKNLLETEPKVAGLFEVDEGRFEFWKKTNMPELIESDSFFLQKLQYIHNNPVKKQYVRESFHWYWSSAIDYETNKCGPLPVVKLLA